MTAALGLAALLGALPSDRALGADKLLLEHGWDSPSARVVRDSIRAISCAQLQTTSPTGPLS